MTENDKTYVVFGGAFVEDYWTESYDDGLNEFLRRVKLTKPETDARIGFLSAWHDKDGVVQIETNHFVVLASPSTLKYLNKQELIERKINELYKLIS